MQTRFLVAVLALCATACSTPEHNSDRPDAVLMVGSSEENALYRKRFAALRDRTGATGLSRYDPLKPVPGAQVVAPLPSAASSIDEAALTSVRRYAAAMNSSAVMIWHNGALIEQTFFSDVDEDTLLVSKSLAKPLSVIAVGRAIEAGYIASLDDSVSTYIREWHGTPKAKMTIRQLLGMRSGLLPQGAAPEVTDVLNRAYLHPRHDDVIINEYPLVDTPGERYEYSNANGELVAVVIERATGVEYEDWVDTQVLKMLGAPGGQVWMNRPDGTAHSGCCWLLPAQSYLRLAILLLDDGTHNGRRLLPEGFVSEMASGTVQNPHAGLGVYVAGRYIERRGPLHPDKNIGQNFHSEPYLADDLYLFDGNSNQVIYIIPSAELIVARLGDWPPRDPGWDNAFLPNTVIRGLPDEVQRSLRTQPIDGDMAAPL
ncbi:MAG: serine hydrolase domain-containing protein [Pseudomonadota bacterium]